MTEEAILHMPYENWLLLTNGRYPYMGKKIMYYLDKQFITRVLEDAIPDSRDQQIAEMPRLLLEQKQLDEQQLFLIEDKSGESGEPEPDTPPPPEEPAMEEAFAVEENESSMEEPSDSDLLL